MRLTSSRLFSWLGFFAATLLCPISHAQVFKCQDAYGKTVYTDGACASHQRSPQIEAARSPADIAADQQRSQEALQRKQQARAEAQAQALAAPSGNQAQPLHPVAPMSSDACIAAQNDLTLASGRIYRTPEERRGSLNALIARSNAACGSNPPLVQAPARGRGRPHYYRN